MADEKTTPDTVGDKKKPTDPETGEGISPPITVEGASNPNEVFGVPEEQEGGQPKLKLPEDYPAIPGKTLESNAYDFSAEKEPRRYGIGPDQVHYPDATERPTTVGQDGGFATAGYSVSPPDEEWYGGVVELYKKAAPLVVEIAGPVGTAIVASPFLLSPDPLSKVAYFGLIGSSSSASNALAQRMRMGYGHQEEFSWQENAAAGVVGLVPGLKSTKDMSKMGMIALRAGEGAVLAASESGIRQGLEFKSGDRTYWNVQELFASAGFGGVIGGSLGRLEHGLIKQSYDETPQKALVRALKEKIKDEKKTIKELGEEKAAANVSNLEQLETALEKVNTGDAEQVLKKAIDQLTAEGEKVTTQFQEAAQDILDANNGQPTAPRRSAEATAPTQTVDLSTKEGRRQRMEDWVRDAWQKKKEEALKAAGKEPKDMPAGWEDTALKRVSEDIRAGNNTPDWIDTRELADTLPSTLDRETGEKLDFENDDWPRTGTLLDFLEGQEQSRIPDDIDTPTLKATPEEAEQILDDFVSGKGKRDEIFDEDTGTTKLDDAGDPVKARLLTDDVEIQQLINVIQDTIGKQLEVGSVSREEYMEKVAEAFESNLGPDEAATFKALMNASLDTTDKPLSAQLEELGIRAAAVGTILTHQLGKVRKAANETDWQSDAGQRNDLLVAIMNTIPQFIEHKRIGSAEGRMLNARKYQNDAIEAKYEEALGATEEQLVEDLKLAKDMTPTELTEQVQKFGDVQAVRLLLQALKESPDTESAKKILLDMQQAFQTNASANRNIKAVGKGTVFNKVSNMGSDVLFSNMLSAPITHMKAFLGNAIMMRLLAFQGYVGAKYMATAPWARRGKTKEEWETAAKFWKDIGLSYQNFNSLSFDKVWRATKTAFKTTDSDFVSHFERIGDSAFLMENTGIEGALGQTLENLGQFIDLPGKSMAAIDMFSKQRVAHSMFYAHAYRKWKELPLDGGDVPDFDTFYKSMLNKVFTEDLKIKNEGVIRKEAVLLAEEQNISAADLPAFVETYVAKNWTAETEKFVEYVKRNVKEVAFQGSVGEFDTASNSLEKLWQGGEDQINEHMTPLLRATFFAFMRTGRNIIFEGSSLGSAFMADTPLLQAGTKKIWAKTMQDLESDDPIVAARAKGRMVVSAGIVSAIGAYVSHGVITGREEQNWKKRENLNIATGLGDYQVRVTTPSGEVIGIDYLALEPFASVAAIMADANTIWKTGSEEEKNIANLAVTTALLTVSNNISNKSYFKNIGTIVEILGNQSEETGTYASRKLRSMGSAAVPSWMNTLEYATDDSRRRNDNILHVWQKRIAGIAQTVPPYRDAFGDAVPLHADHKGEKVNSTQAFSWLIPFKWKEQRADVEKYTVTDKDGTRRFNQDVLSKVNINDPEEVRNAAWSILIELDGEYHFNNGVPIIQTLHTPKGSVPVDAINLQKLKHPETGQDAFDRWQEIYSKMEIKRSAVGVEAPLRKSGNIVVQPSVLNIKQAVVLLMQDKQLAREGKELERNRPAGVVLPTFRLEKLNKLMGEWRKAAFIQLYKEFEEAGDTFLSDLYKDSMERRKAASVGNTEEALANPQEAPYQKLLDGNTSEDSEDAELPTIEQLLNK